MTAVRALPEIPASSAFGANHIGDVPFAGRHPYRMTAFDRHVYTAPETAQAVDRKVMRSAPGAPCAPEESDQDLESE